jgi:hypothetical protein
MAIRITVEVNRLDSIKMKKDHTLNLAVHWATPFELRNTNVIEMQETMFTKFTQPTILLSFHKWIFLSGSASRRY